MEEKVYNEELTEVLTNYDLEKGKLSQKTKTIHHDEIEGQEEIIHYEVIQEYPNGGKDVELVIDQPKIEHQDAYDEEKVYTVYIPYTEKEIKTIEYQKEMNEVKQELASTDYEAIKYAEGWFTEEEYAPIKQHREELREKIRQLEEKLV